MQALLPLRLRCLVKTLRGWDKFARSGRTICQPANGCSSGGRRRGWSRGRFGTKRLARLLELCPLYRHQPVHEVFQQLPCCL